MTEYNIFCYSENFNNINSFQQKRYRAFNKDVGEKRYNEILILVMSLIPNKNKLQLNDFWKSIVPEQWNKLLAIPEATDFKTGFEYISGINIIPVDSLIGKEVSVTIDKKTYTAKIIS